MRLSARPLGEPTGASSVTVADLEVGKALPGDLRTVEFVEPASALVAEVAALQMEMDPDVVSAEPDWIVTTAGSQVSPRGA